MIINIPLDRIHPNPWQTRQGDPDPAYIKELALDIAANGLLQTPIGRLTKNVDLTYSTGSFVLQKLAEEDLGIQLAFGHNRLAAYRWLYDLRDNSNIEGDYSAMPVELRQLTDEQMATLAWSENEKRRDVTPLERALAIQRRIADFNWTQAQAAAALGISRPTVSNALRLLKLPEDIHAALTDGRISERVAMALAGYYDLPEAIKIRVIHSWYSPSNLVQDALDGKLTSDGVRDKINNWCQNYGMDLAKAPFALDEAFMIPDVRAPFCRDCELRYKDRNLCLDLECYHRKLDSFRLAILQRAANDCGIPPHDNQNAQSHEYTGLRYGVPDGALETILAGKCPNLRLRYSPGAKQLPDHPDAEIVCSKREQYCTCLAGLRASQPTKTGHYDYEKREYETIIDAPVVQLDAEQPTAEDLRAAAKEARRAKRWIEQEKQAILQEASEQIAVGLTHGNLSTWKWLARKIHYSLDKQVEQLDNVFDVRLAIIQQLVAGLTYPDSLGKVLRIFNEILVECNLEKIPDPAANVPVAEDQPNGKTLVEIFEEVSDAA